MSCSGICYSIYARQKFLHNALAPEGALALFEIFAGPVTNALTIGIYYYSIVLGFLFLNGSYYSRTPCLSDPLVRRKPSSDTEEVQMHVLQGSMKG